MNIFGLWIGFIALIIFLLLLDLGVFHRKAHIPGIRESLGWTSLWIVLAMIFNAGIYFLYENHLFGIGHGKTFLSGMNINGIEAAKMFFTGYLIEKSLSLDNIFVIGMVFSFFGVPRLYQHRVLFWGIFGALLLRGIMILLGVTLIQMCDWILYIFGLFLLVIAVKMLFHKGEEVHPEKNPLVKLAQRFFRITSDYHAEHFFVKIPKETDNKSNNKSDKTLDKTADKTADKKREVSGYVWACTPMLLVLLVVESNDLIFAIDSIPAIFAITQDPFIVFTSNVFAILGLRSLYFVMAAMIAKFRYLQVSLSVILAYVGVKLLCIDVIHHFHIENIMTWISLGVIIVVMMVGVLASVYANKKSNQ
ncbi:MAG: TerC family protein [Planctomycetaceae bacterium]|jgi:tellurite resistance protein TerC|nr:TerC family protein [Planctomycetaceae bacterium]